MCGILCAFNLKQSKSKLRPQVLEMSKKLRHRGPDWSGLYDCEKAILSHERLAIVDPTSGNQPLISPSKKLILAANGEIYNHKELRAFLEQKGVMFKSSHSDTEALLLGLSTMGMDFLKKLNGQFAIFFHDINKNEYYLIRDRVGQKPLYFAKNSEGFYFGSDLISVKNLSNNYKFNVDQIKNFINFGTSTTPSSGFFL